jgi:hypothetical protein
MAVFVITYNGKTRTVKQWARKMKIPERTLRGRMEKNWPVEQLFIKNKQYGSTAIHQTQQEVNSAEHQTHLQVVPPTVETKKENPTYDEVELLIMGYYRREKLKRIQEDFKANIPYFLESDFGNM